MQRVLRLRLRGEAGGEESLARFLRTLEAGRREAPRWQLEPLGEELGWQVSCDRFDRTHRIRLTPDDDQWELTVESGPPEREPSALRGGEWLVGAALALAAFVVARPRIGAVAAALCGLVLALICGEVLPRLAWRAPAPIGDEPDGIDQELLERVRRGAEAFAGFQLLTRDWSEE